VLGRCECALRLNAPLRVTFAEARIIGRISDV
jgi:hypothetical protein